MTRFFDAHVRPPRGGWNFPISGQLVSAHSESEILGILRKFRKNNGTYRDDAALSEELWSYYCQREPDRCGTDGKAVPVFNVPEVTPLSHLIPAEKTPELQGPPTWTWLNTLAAQWNPGLHNYFMATCDAIIVVLECPICRDEWRKILAETPPSGLASRVAVCQWVNAAHNAVNARKGKAQYPYSKMIVNWGAPIP